MLDETHTERKANEVLKNGTCHFVKSVI